jgi:ABC-type sugar transport system substrate-binding protein
MATKNPYFNPWLEAAKAAGQNAGNFLLHPSDQSQLAMQVAQQMAQQQSNAMVPTSPMQPYMRPGVGQDSPDALTPEQLQLLRQRGLLGQ